MAVRTLPKPDPLSRTYATIAGQALGSVHQDDDLEPPQVPALEELHQLVAESAGGFFGALGELVSDASAD